MRSESRSSLYYNAYEYAMTWQQDEIGCIRSLDQKKMQSHIRVRMEYEHSRNSHYQRYGEKFESKFTTRCRDNLEGMRALLATETQPKKMVFFNNFLTVYTNNLGLHGRLMACDWIESVDIKRAELNLPPDTILLKNPQYQYHNYILQYSFHRTDSNLESDLHFSHIHMLKYIGRLSFFYLKSDTFEV